MGDTIKFLSLDNIYSMEAIIVSLEVYKTFEELYKAYDKVSLGYKKDQPYSPDDMLQYYSMEDQLKYGVVAIGIKLKK